MPRTAIGTARTAASARSAATRRPRLRDMNYSVRFLSTGSYLSIPNSDSCEDLFAGGGTLVVWFCSDAGYGATSYVLSSPTTGAQGWHIQFDGAAGYPKNRLRFLCVHSTSSGQWRTPVGEMAYREWHCAIITYNSDSVANTPTIILDGVEQTLTSVAPVGDYVSDDTKNWRSTGSLNVGLMFSEMRWIKNKMWSVTEAQSYYYDAIVPSGGTPVLTLLFTEGSGTTIADTSGNGNHASIVGTGVWSTFLPPFGKPRNAVA